jgi:hypothetical protein
LESLDYVATTTTQRDESKQGTNNVKRKTKTLGSHSIFWNKQNRLTLQKRTDHKVRTVSFSIQDLVALGSLASVHEFIESEALKFGFPAIKSATRIGSMDFSRLKFDDNRACHSTII